MAENVPLSPVVDIATKQPYIEPENTPLDEPTDFGGGKGGGPVDPSVSMKDYVDARDDAMEARLNGKLDKLPTAGVIRANIWGAAAAIVGVVLAVLAFASGAFNGGLSVSPQMEAARKAQAEIDAKQDAQAALLTQKLDIIIKQTAGKNDDAQASARAKPTR